MKIYRNRFGKWKYKRKSTFQTNDFVESWKFYFIYQKCWIDPKWTTQSSSAVAVFHAQRSRYFEYFFVFFRSFVVQQLIVYSFYVLKWSFDYFEFSTRHNFFAVTQTRTFNWFFFFFFILFDFSLRFLTLVLFVYTFFKYSPYISIQQIVGLVQCSNRRFILGKNFQ